jgi:hypothetical protein
MRNSPWIVQQLLFVVFLFKVERQRNIFHPSHAHAQKMSSLLHKEDDLTSFYAAFRADDVLIDVIPKFEYRDDNDDDAVLSSWISTIPVGPFVPLMTSTVPLWMALFLKSRNLVDICPPAWYNAANLSAIIRYEKQNEALFADRNRLPNDYYEVGTRLVSALSSHDTEQGSSSSSSSNAMSLLLQDLLDIRVDKLRQQFIHLLSNEERNVDFDLTVDVSDIGNQELALLRGFVTQAVTDHYWMAATSTSKAETSTETTTTTTTTNQEENVVVMGEESSSSVHPDSTTTTQRNNNTSTNLPPRLKIRRFRS